MSESSVEAVLLEEELPPVLSVVVPLSVDAVVAELLVFVPAFAAFFAFSSVFREGKMAAFSRQDQCRQVVKNSK